jgi:hypothetical protein
MPTRRLQGQGHRALLRLAIALTTVSTLSTPAGCKSKPAAGRACPGPDQVACAGLDRAFVCEGAAPGGAAVWTEVSCKGARGCARRGGADDCDDTVASEGDPCPGSPPLDYACTADGARALACTKGRFGLWRACRGPEGCRVTDGQNIQCDTTLGEPGDPCTQNGAYACSADRKTMLTCNGTALAAASSCSGPEGCQIERESHRVDCDDSAAAEGDPCDQARRITCSADHKVELVCAEGHYARKRDCRRADCRLEGQELFCD